jgi:hypothetical protein
VGQGILTVLHRSEPIVEHADEVQQRNGYIMVVELPQVIAFL